MVLSISVIPLVHCHTEFNHQFWEALVHIFVLRVPLLFKDLAHPVLQAVHILTRLQLTPVQLLFVKLVEMLLIVPHSCISMQQRIRVRLAHVLHSILEDCAIVPVQLEPRWFLALVVSSA